MVLNEVFSPSYFLSSLQPVILRQQIKRAVPSSSGLKELLIIIVVSAEAIFIEE